MARRLGCPTALVLTGISSADGARAPTVVLDDVTQFPDLLEVA